VSGPVTRGCRASPLAMKTRPGHAARFWPPGLARREGQMGCGWEGHPGPPVPACRAAPGPRRQRPDQVAGGEDLLPLTVRISPDRTPRGRARHAWPQPRVAGRRWASMARLRHTTWSSALRSASILHARSPLPCAGRETSRTVALAGLLAARVPGAAPRRGRRCRPQWYADAGLPDDEHAVAAPDQLSDH
jgi:hypothetical protein